MIHRIKKIQQVGIFRDFVQGGSVQLTAKDKNITIIYGNNRHGKTTLVSIFKSLGKNIANPIKKRISIPRESASSSQYIELSFKEEDQKSEKTIKFSRLGGWDSTLLKSKIAIFDESFVHDNVMLGGIITGANQENIVNLILGEKAVREYDEIRRRIDRALRFLNELYGNIQSIIAEYNATPSKHALFGREYEGDSVLALQAQSHALKYLLDFIPSKERGSYEVLMRKLRHGSRLYHFSRYRSGHADDQVGSLEDIKRGVGDILKSFKTKGTKKDEDKILSEELKFLHKSIQTTINKIDKAISKLKEDQIRIVGQQSEYLETIHESLNSWLNRFGSSEFKVQVVNKRPDKGRHTGYKLQVEYEGQQIKDTDLMSIFSESDKRNLALALFMTVIESKTDNIIVLDDPVVSLDSNSISTICSALIGEAPKRKQVIIVTHYESLLEKMHEMNAPATYVEIIKEDNTAKIRRMDIKAFCKTPLEKSYDKIAAFIKGEGQLNRLILRQFLEESLKARFRKQLKEAGKHDKGLDAIIQELKRQRYLDEGVFKEMLSIKSSLNFDHHKIRDNNTEDTRNLAKLLLQLIYEKIA